MLDCARMESPKVSRVSVTEGGDILVETTAPLTDVETEGVSCAVLCCNREAVAEPDVPPGDPSLLAQVMLDGTRYFGAVMHMRLKSPDGTEWLLRVGDDGKPYGEKAP